ncbi:TFIIA2 [Acanthosepion pharaonis]|uniref:TFIIA2 n=1 Tax=Acanthosepion pharaonis TaxID=158019 RepID=A0A812CJM2_ACAPH|nr:TFIIA2 [Sepia pharaonis]
MMQQQEEGYTNSKCLLSSFVPQLTTTVLTIQFIHYLMPCLFSQPVTSKLVKLTIMSSYQLYRNTTIGNTLQESLDELIQCGQITPQLALKVLIQFDKAINAALASRVRNRVSFKGHLNTYRFCDNENPKSERCRDPCSPLFFFFFFFFFLRCREVGREESSFFPSSPFLSLITIKWSEFFFLLECGVGGP